MNGERNEEEEEETVVPFPDTIVDPRAMMIEFLEEEQKEGGREKGNED